MSLIPFILDLADELHEFSRCLANGVDINDFGFGLYTGTDQQQPQPHQQQQQQPQTSPRRNRTSSFSSYWMPSKRHHPYNRIKTACCAKSGEDANINPEKSDAGTSSIGGTPGKSASYSVVNKNGFQVSMNVKQFAPNELSVKTIDNCIVVEGRHDDKEDGHGVISRHFVRKYMLPKGYDPNDVLSTLSSDGILTVKAPPPPPPAAKNDEPNERVIEIQPTPGPTPVVVASAKDTPAKETSKKVATSPVTRLEYQCPEKRQKLELPPESEPEQNTEASATVPPATAIENEADSASVQAAGTDIDSNDVEMEKADEQNSEIVDKQTAEQQQQQTPEAAEIENDVEKKVEIIEQAEKLREKEQEKILDETEKKLLDECMPEPNGDTENVCEKMEDSCSAEDATETTESVIETPAESKIEEGAENSNKMDVDEAEEPQQNADEDEKMVNSEIVVATNEKADSETKTPVKAAANDDSAKNTNTDPEKTNNTDTSSCKATTTATTTANNNNNSSTKTNTSSNSSKNKATTNNSSSEVVTENSVEDIKSGNGVVTGEIPADIPNSNDCETDITTTSTNNIKDSADDKAESAAVEEIETETAVLSADTNTTTDIIDDVALLKAATADPTSDNIDENDILTESIDGITTTEDLSTTTTVDSVECSLFAKKAHLGNGNNTTATPIVGTEEMAN